MVVTEVVVVVVVAVAVAVAAAAAAEVGVVKGVPSISTRGCESLILFEVPLTNVSPPLSFFLSSFSFTSSVFSHCAEPL